MHHRSQARTTAFLRLVHGTVKILFGLCHNQKAYHSIYQIWDTPHTQGVHRQSEVKGLMLLLALHRTLSRFERSLQRFAVQVTYITLRQLLRVGLAHQSPSCTGRSDKRAADLFSLHKDAAMLMRFSCKQSRTGGSSCARRP